MGHFYFVRHGQTIWNVENKICGATDIALTEFGHQQAVETGEKILKEGIQADEILYSPLVRAADTAKHISGDHRDSGKRRTTADGAEFWKMGVHSTRWSGLQKGEGMLRNEPRGRRIDSAAGAENL